MSKPELCLQIRMIEYYIADYFIGEMSCPEDSFLDRIRIFSLRKGKVVIIRINYHKVSIEHFFKLLIFDPSCIEEINNLMFPVYNTEADRFSCIMVNTKGLYLYFFYFKYFSRSKYSSFYKRISIKIQPLKGLGIRTDGYRDFLAEAI